MGLPIKADPPAFRPVNTLIQGAGIFIWPLAGCSVLVVFLLIERAIALRLSVVAPEAVSKLVREGRAKELTSESASSAAGRLVLRWKEGAQGEVLKAFARAELVQLQRGFFLIDSVVASAPLLGLLGTVTGLASLFPEQGLPDSQMLTRGVGLSLSTTMIGLCIAIPALLGANWLGRRIELLSSRIDILTEGLEKNQR